jgi:hypothetical protein
MPENKDQITPNEAWLKRKAKLGRNFPNLYAVFLIHEDMTRDATIEAVKRHSF